jgi:Zn-dependent protease with chaperone function
MSAPVEMSILNGYWFDGKSSAQAAASLHADDSGLVRVIRTADDRLLQQVVFSAIRISTRIGDTPRFIHFPDGGKFETLDNAGADRLLRQHRPSLFNTLAHKLESHIYFVALTVVMVAGLTWLGVTYGIPAASKVIAYRLPQDALNLASTETLAMLDKTRMTPSRLAPDVQARVLKDFAPALQEYAPLHIRVIFRDGGDIGANAFALPDGTIVFTDEMVELAQNDDELIAVLAHEIGHVKYRHALRSAIQGSSIGFLVSMLTGDLSAASSALAALPVVLTTMSYSRNFEREADQNALAYLDAHKIPRHVFVDLMERVMYTSHCDALLHEQQADRTGSNRPARNTPAAAGTPLATPAQTAARKAQCDKLIAADKSGTPAIMDYLSTHPATEERLQKFRQTR